MSIGAPLAAHEPGLLALLDRALDRTLGAVLIALMAFVVLLTFAQVVLRYGFSSSIFWADEVARYTFVWIVFLAAGLLTGTGAHIAFSALTDRLGDGVQRLIGFIEHALVAALGVVIAVKSWSIVRLGFDTPAPASGIPMAWFQVILIVFGAILVFKSALAALRHAAREPEQG